MTASPAEQSIRVTRDLESFQVVSDRVSETFAEAVEVAHDPNRVPDTEAALAALIPRLLEVGWWEMAIYLSWPGQFLPFAPFHSEALAWWAGIRHNEPPDPFVAVWPRDTGKSTVTMAAFAMAICLRLRPFMLWLSDVEDQVLDKVTSVGTLLQAPRLKMAFPQATTRWVDPTTGNPVDWRQGRIRTGNGCTLDAGGMDKAMRGRLVLLDRPGIIVCDDIEDLKDTAKTRKKKEGQLTRSIFPMGSPDVAIAVVQNLIHKDTLQSQLTDGRADFLHGRRVSGPWPQVEGLVTEVEEDPDGKKKIVVTGGEFTWPEGRGQDVTEHQINQIGLAGFRAEHQHDSTKAEGFYFNRELWVITSEEPPEDLKVCRGWDFAATADGGDYTVGVLLGIAPNEDVWILDVVRGQWDSSVADNRLRSTSKIDKAVWGSRLRKIGIEQEPGSSGKSIAEQQVAKVGYPAVRVPAQTKKEVRAKELSAVQLRGGCYIVEADWNEEFIDEMALFPLGDHDDQVDGSTTAYNLLKPAARRSKGSLSSPASRTLAG